MTGVQITEQMKYCVNVKITKVNDTVLQRIFLFLENTGVFKCKQQQYMQLTLKQSGKNNIMKTEQKEKGHKANKEANVNGPR